MDRLAATSNWNILKSGTSPEPLSTNSARGRAMDPPVEGIWGTFAESNFWIKNLNKTPLNFLKQSSQVNNFTVFFQFFIGM